MVHSPLLYFLYFARVFDLCVRLCAYDLANTISGHGPGRCKSGGFVRAVAEGALLDSAQLSELSGAAGMEAAVVVRSSSGLLLLAFFWCL